MLFGLVPAAVLLVDVVVALLLAAAAAGAVVLLAAAAPAPVLLRAAEGAAAAVAFAACTIGATVSAMPLETVHTAGHNQEGQAADRAGKGSVVHAA